MKLFVIPYQEKTIDENIQNYEDYKYHFKNNDIKLALAIDRENLSEDSLKTFIEQVETTLNHNVSPNDLLITIYNNFKRKVFSDDEIEKLKFLRELYKNSGIDVRVYDYKDAFSIEEVESTSQKIKEIARQINEHNLSPLEKLLSAYLVVTNRKYVMEKSKDSPAKSSSLFSILNNREIVCSGFSIYLKTLADELKDDNIKVFCNMVAAKNENDPYGFHQNNIAYLKDEKYGIDGFFYLDPTWDSYKVKNLEDIKLKYFMLSFDKIKDLIFQDTKQDISDYSKAIGAYFDELDSFGEDDEDEIYERTYTRSESRVRDKKPNSSNIPFPMYSSLTKSTFRMKILKKNSDCAEESLYSYLNSREDFRDFTIKSFLKIKNPNQKYSVADAKKAYWYSKRYPDIFYYRIGMRKMWGFMNKHSHSVDMTQILEALEEVLKVNFPYSSPKDISKVVYDVAKANMDIIGNTQDEQILNNRISKSKKDELDITMDK